MQARCTFHTAPAPAAGPRSKGRARHPWMQRPSIPSTRTCVVQPGWGSHSPSLRSGVAAGPRWPALPPLPLDSLDLAAAPPAPAGRFRLLPPPPPLVPRLVARLVLGPASSSDKLSEPSRCCDPVPPAPAPAAPPPPPPAREGGRPRHCSACRAAAGASTTRPHRRHRASGSRGGGGARCCCGWPAAAGGLTAGAHPDPPLLLLHTHNSSKELNAGQAVASRWSASRASCASLVETWASCSCDGSPPPLGSGGPGGLGRLAASSLQGQRRGGRQCSVGATPGARLLQHRKCCSRGMGTERRGPPRQLCGVCSAGWALTGCPAQRSAPRPGLATPACAPAAPPTSAPRRRGRRGRPCAASLWPGQGTRIVGQMGARPPHLPALWRPRGGAGGGGRQGCGGPPSHPSTCACCMQAAQGLHADARAR